MVSREVRGDLFSAPLDPESGPATFPLCVFGLIIVLVCDVELVTSPQRCCDHQME